MHWNKVTFSLLSLALFFLLFFALYLPLQPMGQILDQGWTVEYRGVKTYNNSIPYIQDSSEAADILTLTIPLTDLQGDGLVFRPGGYAYAVLLNGQQIAGIGDLDEPTANVWNMVQVVPLTNLRSGENVLQIKLSSANRAVGLGAPPYIDEFKTANFRVTFINWFANDFLLINQGAGILVGALLIAIARSRRSLFSTEFYMGVAAILASLYVFDFDMRASTGNLAVLLLVRKVSLISGYLGSLLFVCSLETYYHGRLRVSRIIAVPTVLAVITLAVQPSQFQFSKVLVYLNIVMLINLVAACFYIFRNSTKKDWLIVPALLLTLSILESIIAMGFTQPWPFMTQYIVLFSVVFFGMNLILDFHQLYQENITLQVKANIDPLTGVFNRNVLKDTLTRQYNMLAMIDLDNFKYFNDKYGHAEGDKLLLLFVDTLRRNIRQGDLIVRIGGDEFVLLLNHSIPHYADETLERICAQFALVSPDPHVNLSYGIEMITNSLENSLYHADKRMYEMKTLHKQNIRL
ncbi:MAG: GGDEF domain-containing protein [Anaerolineae bacterium]|nr:GGDEF domain-containing protein [Anaerolineae bacterium]